MYELRGTGQKNREEIKEWKPFLDRTINDDDKKVFQVGRHRFKGLIRYFIDNVYVTFGGRLYRQLYGIQMGANCSPLMANFYLFHCEYEHFDKPCYMDLRSTRPPTTSWRIWRSPAK